MQEKISYCITEVYTLRNNQQYNYTDIVYSEEELKHLNHPLVKQNVRGLPPAQ